VTKSQRIKKEAIGTIKEVFFTVFMLLKIIIPVSIVVKVLSHFGIIEIIGRILGTVMRAVGLPGESGLIWATAMVTNIYGGLIVFFSMAGEVPFTMAQVTVLSTMILVAHSLPVELRIAHAAGVRLWFMLALRVLAAFLLGFILHQVYDGFHLLQGAPRILWTPGEVDPSLLSWILSQLRNYAMIFVIIFVLIAIMRILKATGIIGKLNRMLNPFLRLLGMSKAAAPLTIIGITLGISYGGGLIINEARSGVISKRDIFLSLSLMGLSHSLIEDTLLMVAMGASLTGILLGRILFTLLLMMILIRMVNRISNNVFMKFFVRRDQKSSGSSKSQEALEA
jgi:hypothetical protein